MTILGAFGFMLIEHLSVIDAFYMSVTTVSTVGFGEVKPFSPAGRLFAIILILTGVGSALYLFSVIGELVIEGQLREFLGRNAMNRTLHGLRDHVILCGFGRVGRAVFEELNRDSVSVAVIESDPTKQEELTRRGALYILGSAADESCLEQAAIAHARAIVVATGSDADNVYITLSARERNPSIMVYARGESDAGLRRLKQAGANQVVSAYQWAGMRIAASLLRPSVVDFLQLSLPGRESEVDLEEIRVSQNSPATGKTIGALERDNPRLRIVALKRPEEPLQMIPDPETLISANDLLVVIGEAASLQRLGSL